MTDYTPTTDAVRTNYASSMFAHNSAHEPYAAFNRWLTQHDRDVAAKALEDAARDTRFSISRGAAISLHHECHKHQCKCGNPGSSELVRQCFLAARDELLARAQAIRNGEINP